MEDVSVSFNNDRYYLTKREADIYNKIESANRTNSRLTDMGIRHLNATLLYGESGTGKTSFGRYVAHSLGVPFAYLNFAQCVSSYLGSTSKNIDKVFSYVKDKKCVFMIDEVDAIGSARGEKGDVAEMSRVVISLMQAMDKIENDIVLLGATNRLDIIDEALLRRFPVRHEVKKLDDSDVISYITKFLTGTDMKYNESNLSEYCSRCSHKQSDITEDIIRSIIVSIDSGSEFIL
jgi:SpoVK/Ycf46/Vps4 family AAA+-type ATPase